MATLKQFVDAFLAERRYKTPTQLCRTMLKQGSDKGMARHNYTTLYDALFEAYGIAQRPDLRLFEVGIGSINPHMPNNMGPKGMPGASLRAWAEHLPTAAVVGADLDPDVLFRAPRIETHVVDMVDPASIARLWKAAPGGYDVMIDDGWHDFRANDTFFVHSCDQLRAGGLYIIEDINGRTRRELTKRVSTYEALLGPGSECVLVDIPHTPDVDDNTVMVCRKPSAA